jgi:hypothetical protein
MKGGKKATMDKSVQITLIIVAGVFALGLLVYFGFSGLPSNANIVTGNGQAEMKVSPDLVTIYFNVDTNGTTTKQASDKNTEIVDKMITALLKEGFNRNDIQTINFNIYPDYDWSDGSQTQRGYRATHTLKVELPSSDFSQIDEVIDAGVDAGAGISYINFELSQEKQNEYKAQVLKLASEDAKIKATAIAEGLGKRIGRLVSIADNNFGYQPWGIYRAEGGVASMDAAEAKSATSNITPGEQEVSASVTATFKVV